MTSDGLGSLVWSPPRRHDRIFITGATGTGKTHLARRLFEASAPPRLVIDPKADEAATGGVYRDRRIAVTFHNPPTGGELPDADSIRFVPRDPGDVDAYDAVLTAAFNRPGIVVWVDEATEVMPALGGSAGARRLATQGRSRGIGLIALHQRPVEVARYVVGNAEHVVMFPLYHPDDREHIAKHAGLSPAVLSTHMTNLRRHGFLWYSRSVHVLAVCPPLA